MTRSHSGDGLPKLDLYLRHRPYAGLPGLDPESASRRSSTDGSVRTFSGRMRFGSETAEAGIRPPTSELIVAPGDGLIIYTPGMRELRLWDGLEALRDSFDDIAALAI